MIAELVRELDKLAMQVLKEGVQPYSAGTDIAHEAGRRVGLVAGIQRSRQALIDYHSRDQERDKDL